MPRRSGPGTRQVLIAAVAITGALAGPARAGDYPAGNDLREIRVGMRVADLPTEGYAGFACAADPERKLHGWAEYATCPRDEHGLHAIAFGYDERSNVLGPLDDKYQGTKVAGHPVLLTLLVGDDGRVDGLEMRTDPKARLYLRKKAFLFANQVKARYGEEGWVCSSAPPTGDEAPVGGTFIKEHCEKRADGRRLVLERELLRHSGEELRQFVGETRFTILREG
ncbi:hypothetical protein [Benzoatithermus flavus]|uniref:Uncharacterized protein n=1 Tax=Benzoatithermus flavus TaxID=3108223 RepID=A0ABU8XX81_9PROT